VSIEEPHMYNADDAVARVDGYIVSVAGAGRHIGERLLVRIDGVDRSAATASLVNPVPEEDGDEQVESSASSGRRRGRRGGRRRSGDATKK
jgi:ribonuclease G